MSNGGVCKSALSTVVTFLTVNCGFSVDEVNWFMVNFEVPESAKGLWTVATRLRRDIFPILEGADRSTLKMLKRVMPLCLALEHARDAFHDIPEFLAEPARGKIWIRPGFLDDCPLFGAIWTGCDVKGAEAQFDSLRAHFVVGYIDFRPKVGTRFYLLRNAGRYIRLIAASGVETKAGDASDYSSSAIPSVLRQLPKSWSGTRAFGDRLDQLASAAGRSGAEDYEMNALLFVADVIRGILPDRREQVERDRSAKSKGVHRRPWLGKGEPLSLPRQVVPGEDLEVIDHVGCDDDHDPGLCFRGMDPEDTLGVEQEVKGRARSGGVLTVDGDRLLHIGASNMASAVALGNQKFPFAREQNSRDDFRYLFTALDKVRNLIGDSERIQAVVLIEILLATGQPIERCHASRLAPLDPSSELTFDLDERVFSFMPWHPEGHLQARGNLTLPMTDRLYLALRALVESENLKVGDRLFSAALPTLKKRMGDGLRKIAVSAGATLSTASIGASLYRTIVQQGAGDESPAILITGQSTHRGFVPATYTQLTGAELCEKYDVATTSAHDADFNLSWSGIAALSDANTFGSSYVPLLADVKACVKTLKDLVRATLYLPPHREGPLETHFAYLIYVHCLISFATGWRPNVLPLPDARLIDRSTGMCLLSDKDTDDACHTHLVWLPDICIDQIRLWEEHLELLPERLVPINRCSADALLWEDPIDLSGNRKKNKAAWKHDPRLFFWLKTDGSRQPLQPSQVQEFVAKHFGELDNGHRHFLRTELIRRGVPDAVVRALLGHWRHGEEAFGKFSCLDPSGYRTALASVLPNLLDEMGWTALKSPFWKQ